MKTTVLVLVLLFNVSQSFASDVVTGSVLFYGGHYPGCRPDSAAKAKDRAFKNAELLGYSKDECKVIDYSYSFIPFLPARCKATLECSRSTGDIGVPNDHQTAPQQPSVNDTGRETPREEVAPRNPRTRSGTRSTPQ